MEQSSKKITGEITLSADFLSDIEKQVKNISEFKQKIKQNLTQPISELVKIILGGAINLDASDLHIEPEEEKAKIRVRLDGILQDVLEFELDIYNALLSRIKLVSGLKLNITDRPQDGRFSIIMGEVPIEIRTSTLPAEYGESIVLRILNPKALIEMQALGLRQDLLTIFEREIKKPHGMIIVTGPTGSGKTTTLYAVLRKIRDPKIKIITIEDPIEYHLKGISQTQVDPTKGYDFASGLKSIMRQDPDVVLVGEIRDLKTGKISLQAALTGHLVLSTLHTNDAAGTVARLIALGARPSDIAAAINIAVAQRLVRKVCKKCSEIKRAPAMVIKKIKQGLRGLPKTIKIPKLGPGMKIPQVRGCKHCNLTGHRGRIGIFEAFLIDAQMEKFILTSPSIAALRGLAVKKGMVSLRQDGLIKVLQGITTFEEVERITGE